MEKTVRDTTTKSFEKGGVYAKLDTRNCDPPKAKKRKSTNEKKSYGSSWRAGKMLDKSGGFVSYM